MRIFVVTLGNGPAIVAGFEAKQESDVKRRSQVLNYYSFRMRREKKKYHTANVSDSVVLTNLKSRNKNKTALYEQLECLQHDARPDVSWTKRKNPFVPKRKRKAMYWSRYRNKITHKIEKKEVGRYTTVIGKVHILCIHFYFLQNSFSCLLEGTGGKTWEGQVKSRM